MNWDTKSLRKFIGNIPVIRTREKVKLWLEKDEHGNSITQTKATYPPEDSEWYKFFGNKIQTHGSN